MNAIYGISGLLLILALLSTRKIDPSERGLVTRFHSAHRVVGPGFVWILPGMETLRRVSIDPLSISLPIQSAITRDEIPIQLQASLDAEVRDPDLALRAAKDWRTALISKLQLLMKDKLEELEFDNLDASFPAWTQSIRDQLQTTAAEMGVQVGKLSISNLSPRTRPETS
jgi:regulator of protease activity HflC (stomatin/prohibitin superfamily)